MEKICPMDHQISADPTACVGQVPSDFAVRLMTIVEVVGLLGPISLQQICQVTQLPKTTVWRILQSLSKKRWLRSRLNDGCFELTSDLERILNEGHVARPETCEVERILQQLHVDSVLSVAFCGFVAMGNHVIFETTKNWQSELHVNTVDDIGYFASLASCSRRDALRHLEIYSRNATLDERRLISSGALLRRLEVSARQREAFWSEDGLSFAIPVWYGTGMNGAVYVQGSSSSYKVRRSLISAADAARNLVMTQVSTRRRNERYIPSIFEECSSHDSFAPNLLRQ